MNQEAKDARIAALTSRIERRRANVTRRQEDLTEAQRLVDESLAELETLKAAPVDEPEPAEEAE